ncbi:glycosyltransferase family 4 protein [Parvularcula sp. ZS-1/3]|uniref:Glycosyltransferase family 4 protein n=1 Tax=Parvularcula mediterranea TaxID=2732508 RepID=A0A7Y3W5S7_9PROT|nr:glycosyltransferase family 4 protein [Parvularcula mediterranea]NNU16581.1 glycosyltransferase family 4 protein [Parvularcula mediterranea]
MTPDFSGKTLLQVIPKLEGGGAERTTLEVGKAFIAAGGRSLVISSGGAMVEELERDGSEHIHLHAESKNPLLIARNAEEIAEIIRKENVSILHARSRAPAWSCLSAARKTGVAYVTTYHGVYNAKSGLKRLYNSIMVRSDRVIANSRFTHEHILEQYKGKKYLKPELITTIPRGADLDRFSPEQVSDDRRGAAVKLFGEGLRVVLPGRFTGWKGQTVLIEAAALFRERHPDVPISFLMIGRMDEKPGYVEDLRQKLAALDLGNVIRMEDASDHVPAILAACDIVISASTEPEAFGRVAVEAQAAGKPVIATAHGGALETVLTEKTGLLVPPGDAEALANALTTLHDQGSVGRSEMGRRGMDHARTSFTTEAMTASTLNVYQELLRRQEVQG